MAKGHLGWKLQPDGGLIGEGTSPVSTISSPMSSGWAGKATEKRALVRGAAGCCKAPQWGYTQQCFPRYITAVCCAM